MWYIGTALEPVLKDYTLCSNNVVSQDNVVSGVSCNTVECNYLLPGLRGLSKQAVSCGSGRIF